MKQYDRLMLQRDTYNTDEEYENAQIILMDDDYFWVSDTCDMHEFMIFEKEFDVMDEEE